MSDATTARALDERGFVFIDDTGSPYLCRMQDDGQTWLYYWHPDKRWVSLRRLTQADVWRFAVKALPDDQAEMYHSLALRL